jgi:polar amino acid transport system permease protein
VFRYVVILPALKLMFPALASQFILLMLATSIASQISVQELFHAASIIQSRTFRDFEVYSVIAVLYLALALALRVLFSLAYKLAFRER